MNPKPTSPVHHQNGITQELQQQQQPSQTREDEMVYLVDVDASANMNDQDDTEYDQTFELDDDRASLADADAVPVWPKNSNQINSTTSAHVSEGHGDEEVINRVIDCSKLDAVGEEQQDIGLSPIHNNEPKEVFYTKFHK